MFNEAKKFIEMMYEECGLETQDKDTRLRKIEDEINETGTYTHTTAELEYGARVAWRNSNHCIGRLFWETLIVRDLRNVDSPEVFISEIETHIVDATNAGKIRPMISIFSNDFKLKNEQILRYAGYENKGDPRSRDTTQFIESLGWKKSEADFNLLPLTFHFDGQWHVHEYNREVITEIDIVHDDYPKLAALGLKWYAVPMISNMILEIGGIEYHTVPFNGWYMETEIGVRNFTDTYRYNKLKPIAEAFDLDTNRTDSYWRDRALVEFNYAVYHSFKKSGVSMVDHITASKQFKLFEDKEKKAGRKVTGKWSWLAPPLSPSLVHNYHYGFDNTVHSPRFKYAKKEVIETCPYH
ncbi:nitric oxide synthase oxygenase [Phocicoccus pinnipedialis]|uniref:Nitric oxide synthase oxygenase n=1 Tax=Phocicoccus pinnipedialis TaxID=110845 RepID=A0A6V7R5B5_9BACL|nr:nitric oxide synthase oxygenase [Jeotgalicoccus pinnipedialis]MBP1939641.1 nitric-oxide synthase [Jeotgalicoccus pinnipedialis]CAD2072263.1 Nitric oxide synthase oxygenase [Jeotgalicoccus pinnipedialis]